MEVDTVSRQLSFPVSDNYLCRFSPSSGQLGKSYPSFANSLSFSMPHFKDLVNAT
jgi:hypothetical protein